MNILDRKKAHTLAKAFLKYEYILSVSKLTRLTKPKIDSLTDSINTLRELILKIISIKTHLDKQVLPTSSCLLLWIHIAHRIL